ncbi:MAG: helix-turn-helix domain-containing protein [Candidatus Omnitrophota bacterium]|jgi:hypothetical protein
MGVIYKLRSEVRDFILETKKSQPTLSCRTLASLASEKFKIPISKSSINAIIKEAGLSLSVGRRRKARRKLIQPMKALGEQAKALMEVSPAEPAPAPVELPTEAAQPPELPPVPVEQPPVPEAAAPPAEQPPEVPSVPPAEKPEEPLPAHPEEPEITPTPPEEAAPVEPPPVEPPTEEVVTQPHAEEPPAPVTPSPEEPEEKQPEKKEEAVPEIPTPPVVPEEKAEEVPPEEAPPQVPPPPAVPEEKAEEAPAEEIKISPAPSELPTEADGLGAIMLKAADYLIGGSSAFTEIIQARLKSAEPDFLAKNEALIYASLFDISESAAAKPDCGLWPLINYRLNSQDISSYLNRLQEAKGLDAEMFRVISNIIQEVRGILVSLAQGNVLYLDGQMHTVWSTTHIAYAFSTTIYNANNYINKYFQDDAVCVLFMAPGYDIPTKEFFEFILSFGSERNGLSRMTLYDNKFEELKTIHFNQSKKRLFAFGLWPWQFGQYRKVKMFSDFCPFYLEPLKKELFIAEGEIELLQPNINKAIALRACALKTSLKEKIRLVVLNNIPVQQAPAAEVINLYLSRWPNLEEGFEDFSRKIERFTYTANSQRFFTSDNLSLTKESPGDIKSLFTGYLQALDSYVRWHFLPSGYEDQGFPTVKERFYGLRALLERKKGFLLATFKPPANYAFLKDLGYACHRLNEREIKFPDGTRVWFTL